MASLGLALIAACAESETAGDAPLPALSPVDRDAIELEGAPDLPLTRYANDRYGFAIAVPEGWAEFRAAASEDGSIFRDEVHEAELRVSATSKTSDEVFQEAIEALRDGATDASGDRIGDNEFRGAATDSDGFRIQLRLLRTQDALITGLVRYPAAQEAEIGALAEATLDSLTVLPS